MNYTYRHIWLINFPVMMSILIEQLINIPDAIFLGHIGEIELGASALAGIWYLAIYMLGFGFSLGLQVVIARRNGERNYPETGKTFFQGLLFLSGLAILLCTVSKIFSPIVLGRLIASEEVYAAVIDYLDWRIWGLLFSFPFLALRSFLVGTTLTKPLNKAALAAVLVNIPCNWLLIFHFDMGIAGAAMASSFAELCSLAILSVHILREMNRQAYGLKWQFDRENIAACLPCLYLEHVQPVHRRSLMVCLFRGRRTSGRDGTGGYKCHTQHIHPVFRHCQFSGGNHGFIGRKSAGSRTKGPGCTVMQQGYPYGICYGRPADNPFHRLFQSDFQHLFRERGSDADSSSAVYSSPAELCFRPARLCIHECRNRNRCYTCNFHFSGCDHHSLSDLSMVCKLRQYIPFRILDS